MKNLLIFIFIFFILLFIYFYAHIYVVNFINKSNLIKNKLFVKNTFIFFFIFSLLSLILRTRFNNLPLIEYIYFLGLFWTGIIVILGFFAILANVIKLFFKQLNNEVLLILFVIISIFSVIFSFYEGNKIPKIKEIHIKLNTLTNNLSFVFIADLHVDFKYKNKIGLKIFEEIKKLNPEFIIIGGDFLDPGFVFDENIAKIKNFEFKKISVFGNHEYYFGIKKVKEIFNNLGFEILNNNSLASNNINIIGLGDIRTENLSKQKVLEIIEKNYKESYINILISHQPLYFKEISEKFDIIMLSGHTHKGQIFPFHIFTKVFYKYFYGLYKNKNSYLYVTSGAGVWGPPMRFLAQTEIVKINLY